MPDLAIVTAIYNGYDTLKPPCPQADVDAEWVCITDDVKQLNPKAADGWTLVCEPRPGMHPNRAAKRPKFQPWEYTSAAASIWVDASFRVVSDRFATEALALADPIAQFVHPWRDCLYDEAAESLTKEKYRGEPIAEQAACYRARGHPEHWGLWACGVIARRHTDAIRQLGAAWAHEVNEWSLQDQISQPFVLREAGLRPTGFPGQHLANGWLAYEGSARH
jgi:hypothetical protein